MGKFFDAASSYFKAPRERPKIPEIISYYREQQIAFCMFTVDCETMTGGVTVTPCVEPALAIAAFSASTTVALSGKALINVIDLQPTW